MTDSSSPRRVATRSVVLAAMALPGVWTGTAQAESAPEKGLIGLKYLRYQDQQTGLKRITVDAPSAYLLVPLSSKWSIEGSAVVDSLSGATPREHTSIITSSSMSDLRTAGDVRVTYYGRRSSYGLGLSYSTENDYDSLAISANASFSSADNNTTFSIGFGHSNDTIIQVQKKASNEFLLALTQAMSPRDLLQMNLTVSNGKGFFNDPYKFSAVNNIAIFDTRPGERTQTAILARWNHHFESLHATLRPSYRYYVDTFGVQANTWQVEWAQTFGPHVTLTPLLRYYTQRAANFYTDPDPNDPNVSQPAIQQFYSTDQRLAGYGAFTVGLKADVRVGAGWSFDLKAEGYEQRGEYRLGGDGSPGLEPFRATFFQVGVAKTF